MATGDKQFEITQEANNNLGNCRDKIETIRANYGRNSDEYLDATESLMRATTAILMHGGTYGGRLMAEDDLSFIFDTFITIGIIYTPAHKNGESMFYGTWSMHS